MNLSGAAPACRAELITRQRVGRLRPDSAPPTMGLPDQRGRDDAANDQDGCPGILVLRNGDVYLAANEPGQPTGWLVRLTTSS